MLRSPHAKRWLRRTAWAKGEICEALADEHVAGGGRVQSVPQIFDVVGPEGAQPIEIVQVSIPLRSPRLDERVHDLTAAPEIECVRPLRSHRRDRAAAVEDKRRLSLLEQRADDGAHQEWDVGLGLPGCCRESHGAPGGTS